MSRSMSVNCRLSVDQLNASFNGQRSTTVASAIGDYMNLDPEQQSQARANAQAGVRDAVAEMAAERRRPKSLKGCGRNSIITLMVAQHDQRENSILVSVDGNPANAERIPLRRKPNKQGEPGAPITLIDTTVRALSDTACGFLIIHIPGWLASDHDFTLCDLPQISPDVDWTAEDLACWESLQEGMRFRRESQERQRKADRKQKSSDIARQERRARLKGEPA